MAMNAKDKFERSLTVFLTDKKTTDKEKIFELEEMISLCKSALKIWTGHGITSVAHTQMVLSEKIRDGKR